MKKTVVAVVAVAFIVVCGLAYAAATPPAAGGQVDVNALRQFQKETLPLRDEMQAKRLELMERVGQRDPGPEPDSPASKGNDRPSGENPDSG